MIDVVKSVTSNYTKYRQASRDGRKVADGRWLELDENIDKYMEMYKYPYKDPNRKLLNSLAANG